MKRVSLLSKKRAIVVALLKKMWNDLLGNSDRDYNVDENELRLNVAKFNRITKKVMIYEFGVRSIRAYVMDGDGKKRFLKSFPVWDVYDNLVLR